MQYLGLDKELLLLSYKLFSKYEHRGKTRPVEMF